VTDHKVVSRQEWQAARDELLHPRAQNAAATGTDVPGYLSESPAMTAFTLHDGAVCQTYATMARGSSS
jgi:hypothetical protein